MIHNLTVGQLDQDGAVTRPFEMQVACRLLAELAGTDDDGVPTLGSWKVGFEDGCVILPWLRGRSNREVYDLILTVGVRDVGQALSPNSFSRATAHATPKTSLPEA